MHILAPTVHKKLHIHICGLSIAQGDGAACSIPRFMVACDMT